MQIIIFAILLGYRVKIRYLKNGQRVIEMEPVKAF